MNVRMVSAYDNIIRLSGGDCIAILSNSWFQNMSEPLDLHMILDISSYYGKIRTLHIFIPAYIPSYLYIKFIKYFNDLYKYNVPILREGEEILITSCINRIIIHQMKITKPKQPHQFTVAVRSALSDEDQKKFRIHVKLDGAQYTMFSYNKENPYKYNNTYGYAFLEGCKIPGFYIACKNGKTRSVTIINSMSTCTEE